MAAQGDVSVLNNDKIPRGAPLETQALEKHLRAVASECRRTGSARLHNIRRAIRQLEISLRVLRVRSDAEELTPAARWLVDNARVLEEACVTIRGELRAAPRLPARNGEPRIARLAREWLSHTDARADMDSLTSAAAAWQRTQPLTEGELCLLPLAVRRALLLLLSDLAAQSAETERERTHAEASSDSAHSGGSDAYWERLLCILQEQEDADALGTLDRRLQELGSSAQEVAEREHDRQTRACLWTGNAIASLRVLSAMDFRARQEALSQVHPALSKDPTGVYPRMDFASRAMYRRRAAKLAKQFHIAESTVARKALSLAAQNADDTLPELSGHVGYYLMDKGQPLLWKKLGKTPWRLKIQRLFGESASVLYVALITFGSIGVTVLFWLLGVRSFLVGPSLLVAGEAFRQLVGLFVHRLSPPRRMARLAPDQLDDGGILVVVPTLLTTRAQALEMVRHLSVLRLANPESRLSYMLLADFSDSPAITMPDDSAILDAALSAIRALSDVWNGGFYYLHRAREWNEKSGRFMGRERKRGALSALNALLLTGKCCGEFAAASCDTAELCGKFSLVITLDADTQLPPGTALELAGMMQHPLNRPLTVSGKRRGCAIIQPRMETSAATIRTRIQRIWGGDGGFDPYITAFSDIYQNLCGEGSFAGKGIYDVRAFEEAVRGKIADNTVLSHDLLEGGLAGSSLACDISLYDGQPASLSGWMKRLHRWTRGDWQLLPWLIPFVKGENGWFRNPLSLLNQFKIYDNLRRSLVPAAQVLSLCLSVLLGEPVAFAAGLLLPHARSLLPPSPRSLLSALTHLCLVPHEAKQLIDAALRTVFRVLVTRKSLLEWVPSAEAERHTKPDSPLNFWPNMLASAFLLGASLTAPIWFIATTPLALLWAAAPWIVKALNGPENQKEKLTDEDKALLIDISRRTLFFFEGCVTEETHDLPPDNVQLEPPRGAAPRTSPTNIGMYLLSIISACEMGLLDADSAARRIEKTVVSVELMEKWNGHLYNWYDIQTMKPLLHRYVSSVDAGNLAGCLLLTAQALRSRLSEVDASLVGLPGRLDALASAMDFSKLYDELSGLFYIGVNAETGLAGDSHYDLLASEARLLSYIALMRREVTLKHWHKLGRAMAKTRSGPVLLSWSGTMFEYLLPTLFLKSPERTLLGDTCAHAARVQAHAFGQGPWGVSESGYFAFDPQLAYQYKAFGLPEVALRTARIERVIAPYASAMALSVLPRESIDNLRHMAELGWMSDMGFYEAADYHPERLPEGTEYKLVRSHMAHHQGMIMASIGNLLTDGALTKHFHSLPQAEAYALLLEERKPTRAMLRTASKLRLPERAKREESKIARTVCPEDFPPEVQVLYGAGTTLVCDARGGGYIASNGLLLSRHRQEALYDGGMQIYLRGENGDVLRMGKSDGVRFDRSRAEYSLKKDGLEALLTCFVSPLDGAAIHLLQLHASPEQAVDLEAASFFEVCLSTRADDEAHPAFRNLSIETERLSDTAAIARRRPRRADQNIPLLLHAVGAEKMGKPLLETSRARFLGRGERLSAPSALEKPIRMMKEGATGAVIDPCMSLRLGLHVEAGTSLCCWFITAAAKDLDKARQIASAYPDRESVARALELAITQDEVNVKYIGLSKLTRLAAQRLASFLVFPLAPEHPSAEGRSALWPFSISGDLPVFTVRIGREAYLPLARSALRAHAYLHALGLWSDLVFLCEQPAEYARPLHDALHALIASGPTRDLLRRDAGVHLITPSDWTEKEIGTLLSHSAIIFTGGEGSLSGQLLARRRRIETEPAEWKRTDKRYPEQAPVSAGNLALDNGFGGFRADGGYVIHAKTPAPYANVLANASFGTVITERGGGFTFADNSRMRRVTAFASDPVRDMRTEHLYLRDEESGQFIALMERALVTHGFGFTRFESVGLGVRLTLTVFVDAEMPVKCMLLEMRNEGDRARLLSITACVQWLLGSHLADAAQVRCGAQNGIITAYSPTFRDGVFFAIPGRDVETSFDGAAFFGTGGVDNPRGMRVKRLDGKRSDVPCGILRTRVKLSSGECEAACVLLGTGDAAKACRAFEGGGAQLRFSKLALSWQARQSALMPRVPDAATALMLGCWMPYQALSSRILAHSGFYQAGGAIGFRDQLQDMLAFLYTEPERVRAHILDAAAHQFEAGDVQHWWHAPALGVRTRITDDRLFLPYVTAQYVRVTEDTGILDESVPFLADVQIPEGHEDWYGEARASGTHATLHEHNLRAIRSIALGEHGLPLIGAGDWNDGMSAIGLRNRGESVWLGFFLAHILSQYAEYAKPDEAAEFRERREALMDALETHAWDGQWYRRAWFDDGTALGSQQSAECRIDLVVQAWAVLAGARRAEEALQAALAHLVDERAGVIKLLDPPFDGATEPGYIRAYPPGIRENGGQYTHAAAWVVMATALSGRKARAWELFEMLLPTTHAKDKKSALRYRVEPYVIAADIGAGAHLGRGGWTWYTGSASLLWCVGMCHLLGFEKRGNKVRLTPSAPDAWQGYSIEYRIGETVHILRAVRGDEDAGFVELVDDGGVHEHIYALKG